ncbi:MAG: GNAT family N-acetyltransferase [Planctomycetales bacterium]|nr:GNAT family N-acetyltransferase [Planctomycetales bacterium]
MFDPADIVVLKDCRRRCDCRASLLRATKDLAKLIDSTWWQIGGSKSRRDKEGDHSWRWADIYGECRRDPWAECLCVVTDDGAVQGAVNYHLDAKSLASPEHGAVFVHHIATAPRNRPWLVDQPEYRGIGVALLAAAVRHGYSLGLEGRTVVPSLPTEQTRQFYENRGFIRIDEDADGIIDYELPPDVAQDWLRSLGYLE